MVVVVWILDYLCFCHHCEPHANQLKTGQKVLLFDVRLYPAGLVLALLSSTYLYSLVLVHCYTPSERPLIQPPYRRKIITVHVIYSY